MESIGVLMTCPMSSYLENELQSRFNLLRLWTTPDNSGFLETHKDSIRAIVGNASFGADARLIEALPKLEIVASYSVGLDKIDLEKCKEKGIRVTNTPDVLTDDVADLAIGLMLAVLRRLCVSDRFVRSGKWKTGDFKLTTKVQDLLINLGQDSHVDEPEVLSVLAEGQLCGARLDMFEHESHVLEELFELENVVLFPHVGSSTMETHKAMADFCHGNLEFTGKSVGIIGLGRIGMAIAKRAEAFSCPINYYSRTEKPGITYKYYPSVVELAENSDILVVACALTEETRHIINGRVIDALGPKGVLINIGRGPHVDEPELVAALVEGRLGGAGLDVFEHEPHVPEELFGLENVVLLPHVGSGTVETRNAMADLVIGNLEAHFSNKPLLTPVI